MISRNNNPAPSTYRTIGMMSGTSLDGVDAALIETDGHAHVRSLGFVTIPYPEEFRARVRGVFGMTADKGGRIADIARDLTDHHLAAVLALLAQSGFQADEIDMIGFHGQTITHMPHQHFTWQIGDPQRLSSMLARPVVADFRLDDVKAGGQGAPLIPIYHQALTAAMGISLPVVLLNLGGVGNITYIGPNEGDLIAFDTGPGNALIDDLMLERAGMPFDRGGETARRGHVHMNIVGGWVQHPYFSAPPPKSLDRNDFDVHEIRGLSLEDGAATLAAFTAVSVASALNHCPLRPRKILVTGGGRHNQMLMHLIAEQTGIDTENVDRYMMNGDAMEAEGFAYMAVRRMLDLPISFPGTTGAPAPMTGGRIYYPADEK